jgi:hypothetical protein
VLLRTPILLSFDCAVRVAFASSLPECSLNLHAAASPSASADVGQHQARLLHEHPEHHSGRRRPHAGLSMLSSGSAGSCMRHWLLPSACTPAGCLCQIAIKRSVALTPFSPQCKALGDYTSQLLVFFLHSQGAQGAAAHPRKEGGQVHPLGARQHPGTSLLLPTTSPELPLVARGLRNCPCLACLCASSRCIVFGVIELSVLPCNPRQIPLLIRPYAVTLIRWRCPRSPPTSRRRTVFPD